MVLRFFAVLLKSLLPLLSRVSIANFLLSLTIEIYLSLIGRYFLGTVPCSSSSVSYSASFSIMRPRYFTCLVCVSIIFALAWLGGLSLFSPEAAAYFCLIMSELLGIFSLRSETSLTEVYAGRAFFGLSLSCSDVCSCWDGMSVLMVRLFWTFFWADVFCGYWFFEAFKKKAGMICWLCGLVDVVLRSLYGAPYQPELALLTLHAEISILLKVLFSEIVISIFGFLFFKWMILIYFIINLISHGLIR